MAMSLTSGRFRKEVMLLFGITFLSISFIVKMHLSLLHFDSVAYDYTYNYMGENFSTVKESAGVLMTPSVFDLHPRNITIVDENSNSSSSVNQTTIDSIGETKKNIFDEILPIYQNAYENFQKIRSVPVKYDQYNTNSTTISLSTYGENVLKDGCDITVQIMDPRISILHRGGPAFFSLESVATFLPNACVVITTSKCNVEWNSTNATQMTKEDVIYQHIYESSLPLFQKLIEKGRVRVKFLNHTLYKLKSCDDFYSPSSAMMNINYWGSDQFIDGVDSDAVIVIQDDSVLCNTPNLDYLRQFPFIGSLWADYECKWVERLWKLFTIPLQAYRELEGKGLLSEQDLRMDLINMTETMDPYCQKEHGIGPIGNGGLSLRSRIAMMNVIKTCPHEEFSGIPITGRNFPCQTREKNLPEDIYFATGLRGLRAKMPLAFEAALFSVERLWPIESAEKFGGPTTKIEQLDTFQKISNGTVNFVHVRGREEILPLGFHQLSRFNDKSLFTEGIIWEQCPFASFIYDPMDKRNYKPRI